MNSWPQFQSHKVVRAARITGFDDAGGARVCAMVDPGNGLLEQFVPTMPSMLDTARVGWYAMIYRDGYKSICPATEFEDGYSLVQNEKATES